jgi:hypothetical protein
MMSKNKEGGMRGMVDLIVICERFRHCEVNDVTNIRFVDSHSEGDCGTNNLRR